MIRNMYAITRLKRTRRMSQKRAERRKQSAWKVPQDPDPYLQDRTPTQVRSIGKQTQGLGFISRLSRLQELRRKERGDFCNDVGCSSPAWDNGKSSWV